MRVLSRIATAAIVGALVGGLVAAVAESPADARTGHLTPEQVIQDDSTLTLAAPVVLVTDAGREVALYLEDNRSSGSQLVAATRERGQTRWAGAQQLTRKGVVTFAAVTLPGGRVTVAYRFHHASSSFVATRLRTLGPRGVWGRPVRLARERVPARTGVEPGLAFDVDRHGVVAAWPTGHGVRVVVRRSDGSPRERVLFPHLTSVELAHLTSGSGVDVVGTRVGDAGPSGVVVRQTSDGTWTRACFVNCSTHRPPLTITSASMNDRGELAVAWTHPSGKAFTDNNRSLVRFRDRARHWTTPTLLARQATSGPQVTIDADGVAAVAYQIRPPHRVAVRLRYHRQDGRWVGGHSVSSRRPSFAGDPEPLAVTDTGRDTLIVYKQARRFAEVDQMRAVVRRCPVRGPCLPWRWVPTNSTDVGAAALPHGVTTLVWADGCAVVFENCFFQRVASRRLLPPG